MDAMEKKLLTVANIEGNADPKQASNIKPWLHSQLYLCVWLALSSSFVGARGQDQDASNITGFVIYEGGFDDTNMRCSSAVQPVGFLPLIPDSANNLSISSGRCLYPASVHLLDPKDPTGRSVVSFSTTFTFSLNSNSVNRSKNKDDPPGPLSLGGFAFVIVADSDLGTNEAETGTPPELQYLGVLNETSNNKNSSHTFAVEFDVYSPTAVPMFNDPPYDHVGIDLNSMNSTFFRETGYYHKPCENNSATVVQEAFSPINLTSGAALQAWIEYEGVDQRLTVTLGNRLGIKPSTPLLNQSGLDLSFIIQDSMYVGFTCAGVGTEYYVPSFLYGWSFNTSGPAELFYSTSRIPSEGTSTDLSSTNCSVYLPTPDPPRRVHVSTSAVVKTVFLVIGDVCLIIWWMFIAYTLIVRCTRRYRRREMKTLQEKFRLIELEELEYGPIKYTYKALRHATDDFADAKILGRGGSDPVYLGVLPLSGSEVAVKRLSAHSLQPEAQREFMAEIRSIGRLRHRNLVQLAGWCHEKKELLLVYEYMPNGSLAQYLFKNTSDGGQPAGGAAGHSLLEWNERFQILVGLTRTLLYLHEEWEQRVVHRDVKASNVMLDSQFNARLGNFGLARSYQHSDAPVSTILAGTPGYLAPETTQTLKATPETDVYSFGVVALEVVCGRRAVDTTLPMEQVVLVNWVRDLCNTGRMLDAVDSSLGEMYEKEEVLMALKIGVRCTLPDPDARPSMRRVLQVFQGEAPLWKSRN